MGEIVQEERRADDPSNEPQRGWLSLSGACRYVGMSRATIRKAVNGGQLVAKARPETGRHRKTDADRSIFSVRELDRWLDSQPDFKFV